MERIHEKLEKRGYASVAPFSADLGSAFAEIIGMSSVTDASQVQSQILDDRNAKKELTAEDKEKRKLAKRIVKAVQAALEDAMHKESELLRRPYEQELLDFDQLLERSISSRRISDASLVRTVATDADATLTNGETTGTLVNGVNSHDAMELDTEAQPTDQVGKPVELPHLEVSTTTVNAHQLPIQEKPSSPQYQLTPASMAAPLPNGDGPQSAAVGAEDAKDQSAPQPAASEAIIQPLQAPTPPLSTKSSHTHARTPHMAPERITKLSLGGILWYMDAFDPSGTTIYEERWTGRDVARGMSEDLTDMDEDELDGLVDGDMESLDVDGSGYVEEVEDESMNGVNGTTTEGATTRSGAAKAASKVKPPERKKNGKLKKRWRGFR